MNERNTESMKIAKAIAKLADDLKWCVGERYTADGSDVIKGPYDLVSIYSMTTDDEAQIVAAGLEAVISPVRRKRVGDLIAQLKTALDELSATDY